MLGQVSSTRNPVPGLPLPLGIPPYYISGSTQTTTVGTGGISSGATSGPVASCIDFVPYEGIFLAGAGASGVDLVTSVVSCIGTTLTWMTATSTTISAGATVMHDDTAGLQAAVNALSIPEGKIILPDGHYWINGPLQQTSGPNCRICLPVVAQSGTFLGTTIPTVLIEGVTPPTDPYTSSGPAMNGAILETKESGGYILGGGNAGGFTQILAELKYLTFRQPNNPTGSDVNFGKVAEALIDDVTFDVNVSSYWSTSQPTTATATALVMPLINNQNVSYARNVVITGYYQGLVFSEHFDGDNITIALCVRGLVPTTANHGAHITRLGSWWNVYNIYPPSGPAYLTIDQMDIENGNGTLSPGWSSTTTNIYDPSNYLFGSVVYQNLRTGVSGPTLITVAGGSNLFIQQLAGQALAGFNGLNHWAYADYYFYANNASIAITTNLIAGSVTFTPGTSEAGLENTSSPDFTSRTWTARVPSTLGGAAGQTKMWMGTGQSNCIILYLLNGTLTLANGSTTIATANYDSTNDLWWRLQDNGSGTISAQVAPDGSTWSTPTGFTVSPGWSYTSGAFVGVGVYVGGAFTGAATFDHFSFQ